MLKLNLKLNNIMGNKKKPFKYNKLKTTGTLSGVCLL